MVHIIHHELLDSTQYEAQRLFPEYDDADAGVLFVVTAHAQTHGRGRFNRTWSAPGGTCSLTTFGVRIPRHYREQAPWLTALGALAAYETISTQFPALTPDLAIKWPNDLMIDGKKLGGVIATIADPPTASSWIDIAFGIGINTTMSARQLPVTTATSIRLALDNRNAATAVVTDTFRKAMIATTLELIELWQAGHYDARACGLATQFEQRLATIGEQIIATVLTNQTPHHFTGTMTGVTNNGHAIIHTATGSHILSAGDVTLRRI